jgi:hypothetical protein
MTRRHSVFRVMAGLDPAVYCGTGGTIDGRVKPGHDDTRSVGIHSPTPYSP